MRCGSPLAAHDAALCQAIEAHGGWVFKHTGDGVCAAFGSPRFAVDATVAAQRALELPVRMGLATGEAELREGDYFGAVLNRAARVMAAGHGGQILLADRGESYVLTTGTGSGKSMAYIVPITDRVLHEGVRQRRTRDCRAKAAPAQQAL